MLTTARILFGIFFFGSALLKIWKTDALAAMLGQAGFDNPVLFVYFAAFCQALAGAALIGGVAIRWACIGLITYVAVINYFMHPFWVLTGEEWSIQFQLFSKNLGIMAGLLAVAGGYKDWAFWPKKEMTNARN